MESSKEAERIYQEVEWQVAKHLEVLTAIIRDCNEDLEGNCFFDNAKAGDNFVSFWWMFYKRVNLVNLIKSKAPQKVAEIGINAGHSALLILHSLQPTAQLHIFDLNNHKYSRKAFEYLAAQYPQLREMVVGDSTVSLPQFIKVRPEEVGTYDIIHVDGGHQQEVVYSDVFYADLLLKSGGVMILDDTNIPYIQTMIERMLKKGYTFLHQLPTFGYMHCFLVKP
jgi:hypothetical protein